MWTVAIALQHCLCLHTSTPSACHRLIWNFVHKNWRTSNSSACKWRYFLTFSIVFHVCFLLGNWIYLAHWALECLVMPFLYSRWQRTYLLLCFYTFSISDTSGDLYKICFMTCGWWLINTLICIVWACFRIPISSVHFGFQFWGCWAIVLSHSFHFLTSKRSSFFLFFVMSKR